jgi:hypothetical protein
MYGVVLFFGTQGALRAEKVLKKAGHEVKLIPTPRQLSSDCGVALRFPWLEFKQVHDFLTSAHVDFDLISPLN